MSLVGYSPWGPTGSRMKWLSMDAYIYTYIYICVCVCVYTYIYLLLLFSCSVVSNSLWLHGLQLPGFPVLHHLLELAQTHVHWVGDAIQPSYPLLPPSPPASCLSQHQLVGSLHQVAKVFELQLQHQSFQWTFRIDFPMNWLVWSPCSPRDSQESSSRPSSKASILWRSAFFMVQLSHPYMTIYIQIYIYILLQCFAGLSFPGGWASASLSPACVSAESALFWFVGLFFWLQQEELGQVFWRTSFHSPYQGLSSYYWVYGWAGFLSGPGALDVRSHNTHKGAFVQEWMSILLSEGEDKKRNTLHQCDASITDKAVSFWI